MGILFSLIGIAIIGFAVFVGLEVAHDEDRFMTLGIAGCTFLGLSGIPFFSFGVENIVWKSVPFVLLGSLVLAAIGGICLYLWKKGK